MARNCAKRNSRNPTAEGEISCMEETGALNCIDLSGEFPMISLRAFSASTGGKQLSRNTALIYGFTFDSGTNIRKMPSFSNKCGRLLRRRSVEQVLGHNGRGKSSEPELGWAGPPDPARTATSWQHLRNIS